MRICLANEYRFALAAAAGVGSSPNIALVEKMPTMTENPT